MSSKKASSSSSSSSTSSASSKPNDPLADLNDPEILKLLAAGDMQGAVDRIISKTRENGIEGVAEKFQQILASEKFDSSVLTEIREVSKSIRSKLRSRNTSQETLLSFLFRVAEYANKEDYMRPVAECGILDILFLLATHPNADIQMTSLFILSELAIDDANAVRFQKEGAVSLALKAGESPHELSRIYSVKLLAELSKIPENNSSLSLFLLKNEAFVKNLLWMHRVVKPYKLKMVMAKSFFTMDHELCLLSARALGMLTSSKAATQRAEELELFDPLIEYASKGFSTIQQKNLFHIIIWTFGRALSTGGLNRDRLVIGNIYQELQGQLPPVIATANLFSNAQVPFVPQPAPEFSYEVKGGSNEIELKDPKAVTGKRCALLSCNQKATENQKLMLCSGCKISYYCSREHQIQDWKEGHKGRCKQDSKSSSS